MSEAQAVDAYIPQGLHGCPLERIDCTIITGNLSVTGNQLVSVELPLLTRIDGFFTVWGNPILTRVTLPMLASVGSRLDVSSNAALTSLDLPALKSVNERADPAVYDLIIRDNALPTCQADAIRDQLIANGFRGTVSISGNRGTCPPLHDLPGKHGADG